MVNRLKQKQKQKQRGTAMDLTRIKSITDKNIDRIKKENLYRGHKKNDHTIAIQCMDKDLTISFDFMQETATIECRAWYRILPIEFMAPKMMFASLKTYC